MSSLLYITPTPLSLKNHPHYNEVWLRDRIVENPAILGLGELEVKDVERIHPKAGRLDLLLRDPDSGKRYEVEIMLGTVDESHIIRTLEYWDIERKRYPQYDHTAVIVAENITSRFLNVIGLFNGAIPIIAIQLNALQVGESIVLHCTKVLDELILGADDEDEPPGPVTDRAYWEAHTSKESLKTADECLAILKEIDPQLEFKYNKYYIGLSENGRANNFIEFRMKRAFIRLEVAVGEREHWQSQLEEAGIIVMEEIPSSRRLRFRLQKPEVTKNRELLKQLFTAAYQDQQH